MRSVLRRRPGVHLVVVGSGADALEAADATPPDLVVLDRNLPDMTGHEILRLLRARPATHTTPVIVVSGDTATPRAGEAELGVMAYITKPYDIHELLANIDRALDLGLEH